MNKGYLCIFLTLVSRSARQYVSVLYFLSELSRHSCRSLQAIRQEIEVRILFWKSVRIIRLLKSGDADMVNAEAYPYST